MGSSVLSWLRTEGGLEVESGLGQLLQLAQALLVRLDSHLVVRIAVLKEEDQRVWAACARPGSRSTVTSSPAECAREATGIDQWECGSLGTWTYP